VKLHRAFLLLLAVILVALLPHPAATAGATFDIFSQSRPLVITKLGIYQARAGATITLTDHASKRCVEVKCGGVTIRDLVTVGGYRGFHVGPFSGVRFERCIAKRAGDPNGRGGGTFFGVNMHDATFDRCQGISVGSHAFYASNWTGGTTQNLQVLGCSFSGNTAAQVFQINTESGGRSSRLLVSDTTIQGDANLLGAGVPDDPVKFVRCRVSGQVIADRFTAPRDTFAVFQGSNFGSLRVGKGSRVVRQ
jgi:hypothetical protein